MKNLLKISELHKKISAKGRIQDRETRGTRIGNKNASGKFWHERKKQK